MMEVELVKPLEVEGWIPCLWMVFLEMDEDGSSGDDRLDSPVEFKAGLESVANML